MRSRWVWVLAPIIAAQGCTARSSQFAFTQAPPTETGTAETTAPTTGIAADTAASTATDTAAPCETTVLGTWPADGASDVYPGGAVWFYLEEPDSTAFIDVVGPTGVVPGSTSVDGALVQW